MASKRKPRIGSSNESNSILTNDEITQILIKRFFDEGKEPSVKISDEKIFNLEGQTDQRRKDNV